MHVGIFFICSVFSVNLSYDYIQQEKIVRYEMNHPLKNMLTEKPTGWKIWYVIFPTISLVGASVLLGFALTLAGNNESLTSLSPIL